MKKQTNCEEIEKIKKELPSGSYAIIAKRLAGLYTQGTIRQMFNGWRTMSPQVLKEADEYLKFINQNTTENEKDE
jgi:DNA gyrase inhibitor GyrI